MYIYIYIFIITKKEMLFFMYYYFFFFHIVPPKSTIWNYFIKNGDTAKCKLCQLNVKTSGNTTNLHFYLRRLHPNIQMDVEKKSTHSLKRKQMVTYLFLLFINIIFILYFYFL